MEIKKKLLILHKKQLGFDQEKESEWLQLVKIAKKDEFLLEKQKTENRFYDGSCNTFTDSFLYNLEEVWYDSIVIKWCRIF